jgi:hypothetical protein
MFKYAWCISSSYFFPTHFINVVQKNPKPPKKLSGSFGSSSGGNHFIEIFVCSQLSLQRYASYDAPKMIIGTARIDNAGVKNSFGSWHPALRCTPYKP